MGASTTQETSKEREMQVKVLERINANQEKVLSGQDTSVSTKILLLNENIRLRDSLKANLIYTAEDTIDLNRSTSDDYTNLSFYYLLNTEYEQGIAAANKGLALSPDNELLFVNLALGYLLSKKYEQAEKIYISMKDNISAEEGTAPFACQSLEYIKNWQEMNLIPADNKNVIRIKKILRSSVHECE